METQAQVQQHAMPRIGDKAPSFKAVTTQGEISWFIAGTLPEKQLTPLALALVLEDGSPSQAQSIGRELLQFILLP